MVVNALGSSSLGPGLWLEPHKRLWNRQEHKPYPVPGLRSLSWIFWNPSIPSGPGPNCGSCPWDLCGLPCRSMAPPRDPVWELHHCGLRIGAPRLPIRSLLIPTVIRKWSWAGRPQAHPLPLWILWEWTGNALTMVILAFNTTISSCLLRAH